MVKIALMRDVRNMNQAMSQSCEISSEKVKESKLVYFSYFCNNCFFQGGGGFSICSFNKCNSFFTKFLRIVTNSKHLAVLYLIFKMMLYTLDMLLK